MNIKVRVILSYRPVFLLSNRCPDRWICHAGSRPAIRQGRFAHRLIEVLFPNLAAVPAAKKGSSLFGKTSCLR